MQSLNDAIFFFLKFTNAELSKNLSSEVRDYLSYKTHHCYGVLTSTQKIVSLDPKLYLTKTETKSEFEIAAMLHDIGRFTQHDGQKRLKNSIHPHGEVGYDILKKSGLHNPRILLSVKHHGKYDLSELDSELDYMTASSEEKEKILRICHLIRDADKLQNLEYMLYDSSHLLSYTKKDTNREAKSVSDVCFDAIKKRIQLEKKQVETAAELVLYHYSWIFDIYHEGTKIALKQMKFKERFSDILAKL